MGLEDGQVEEGQEVRVGVTPIKSTKKEAAAHNVTHTPFRALRQKRVGRPHGHKKAGDDEKGDVSEYGLDCMWMTERNEKTKQEQDWEHPY